MKYKEIENKINDIIKKHNGILCGSFITGFRIVCEDFIKAEEELEELYFYPTVTRSDFYDACQTILMSKANVKKM